MASSWEITLRDRLTPRVGHITQGTYDAAYHNGRHATGILARFSASDVTVEVINPVGESMMTYYVERFLNSIPKEDNGKD